MLTEHRSWSWYRPFDTLIVFLKDALKKIILKKKSADDYKTIKLIQRARSYFGLLTLYTFLHVYLLNRRMPDLKKYISMCTQNQE